MIILFKYIIFLYFLRVVKFKYTSRIYYIMTRNNEKILKVLKEAKRQLTTTELAEKTEIDIRNISRYTKQLEIDGYIKRKIIQNGKIRVVNISIKEETKKIKMIPEEKKEIKITIPKKEQKIIAEDIEKLTIDELRAYYIVICKKKPKHDSKQDKRYLVNEIIKVLNLSKK